MEPTLSRRTFLGSVAAGSALLVGCTANPSFTVGCTSSYTLYVKPLTDAELADFATEEPYERYEETTNELIATAASEGAATYSTLHRPPVQEEIYVEHEGRYYRVQRKQTATRERIAHNVRLKYDNERTPPDNATVFSFDELPEADQDAILNAYPDEELRNGSEPRGFSTGGYGYVYPDGAESQLQDAGTVWIRYDGRILAITVIGGGTVQEVTYRYTLEPIADDQEAFVAFVREQFVVTLDGLSASERNVFERAIVGEFSQCEPLSGGFRDLKARLEEVPKDRRLDYLKWPVVYKGKTYGVRFTYTVV